MKNKNFILAYFANFGRFGPAPKFFFVFCA